MPPARDSRPPGAQDSNGAEPSESRRRLERLLRDTVRGMLEKGLEAGLETLNRTDRAIRGVVSGELPRELTSYVFQQIDETKNALVRVVAREVREFLDATDLADVLKRALTSLSFEVRMQVRFVPNEDGVLRPRVRAAGGPRRSSKAPPEDGNEDEEEDGERVPSAPSRPPPPGTSA